MHFKGFFYFGKALAAGVGIILVVHLLRTSFIGVDYVQSGSMLPTIAKDDGFFVNHLAFGINLPFRQKLATRWAEPDRGEMVTFRNPDDAHHIWLKRVIGLPGDTLFYRDKVLYLNGAPCQTGERKFETIPHKQDAKSITYRIWHSYLEEDWGPVTVPEGHLFLMGDNRGSSMDSRDWGAVPMQYLQGRILFRFWPLERFGNPQSD